MRDILKLDGHNCSLKEATGLTKLKYKPVQTFTVQKNHFFGELYKAAINQYPGKAVIAFGGSTGTITINRLLAEQFADAGIDVMIIEYHGKEGLPEDLLDQPVEVVGYAAEWLRKAGYKKIGVWGISMGTCLAVLAAVHFPDLISCAVLVSPMHMVTQAEKKNDSGVRDGSAFALYGKPFPYAKWNMDSKAFNRRYFMDCLKHRDLYSRGIIEEAYQNNIEDAALLPVEKIKGSILFISGCQDGMCPASESSRFMMNRLEAHDFLYPHEHLEYTHLGHFILPFKPYVSKLLIAERKYPKECDAERAQAWKSTLDFLHNKW